MYLAVLYCYNMLSSTISNPYGQVNLASPSPASTATWRSMYQDLWTNSHYHRFKLLCISSAAPNSFFSRPPFIQVCRYFPSMPKPLYEPQSFQSFSSFVCYEDFLPAAQPIIMLIRPGVISIPQRRFPRKDYAISKPQQAWRFTLDQSIHSTFLCKCNSLALLQRLSPISTKLRFHVSIGELAPQPGNEKHHAREQCTCLEIIFLTLVCLEGIRFICNENFLLAPECAWQGSKYLNCVCINLSWGWVASEVQVQSLAGSSAPWHMPSHDYLYRRTVLPNIPHTIYTLRSYHLVELDQIVLRNHRGTAPPHHYFLERQHPPMLCQPLLTPRPIKNPTSPESWARYHPHTCLTQVYPVHLSKFFWTSAWTSGDGTGTTCTLCTLTSW